MEKQTLNLGKLEYTKITDGDYTKISYGNIHDRISYGNYDWFYTTHLYKTLQDDKSDLAIALILPDSKELTHTYAINLVLPVIVGFHTDQEPKKRVMILSAQHCLNTPEQITKETLLNIRPECFEVLGRDYKVLVENFINHETISKLRDIVKEHYAKKAKGGNSN